jgi:RNAse (barnase) inhibitor barstar
MKKCVLDGSRLPDAAAVYRELAQRLGFPCHFGHNPDALWDALGERSGEPVAVVWRDAARSAELLGPRFDEIVAVLQRAATLGMLTFELK